VLVEQEVLAAVVAEVLLVVLELLAKVTMAEVVLVPVILVQVAAAVLAQLVEQEHQQLVVMVALVHTQQ
jgi:hypothetical protein